MAAARGSRACVAILMLAASLTLPRLAAAHPMGNFSVNHFAELRVETDALALRYVIDMAEIPTFQEIQASGIVPEVGHPSLPAFLASKREVLKRGLRVEAAGRPVELESVSSEVSFPAGAGGLPTLRLETRYRARLDASLQNIGYRDTNFPDRVGWKEIVVREGRGVALVRSSAPATDRSAGLTEYPTDLTASPPQDLEARVVFTRQTSPVPGAEGGSPRDRATGATGEAFAAARAGERGSVPPRASAPETGGTTARARTPRSAFTELMTAERLSPGLLVIALAVAAALGAFHALEPGHGKTLVAAYLVGSRGTARHAALLGLVVTATHTAAVYVLGAVTLYASRYVVPERLYPWLGLISGLAVAGVGLSLLSRRYGPRADHHHHAHHGHPHGPGASHDHHHDDHHHDHAHHHGHHHHHVDADGPPRASTLLALGVTGGIVPCPAALVVLLSAVSLHRVGFGLLLIVAFSAGLAAVLIGLGLVMVYARRFVTRLRGDGALTLRWLPLASAAVIMVTGVGLTLQALLTLGVRWPAL